MFRKTCSLSFTCLQVLLDVAMPLLQMLPIDRLLEKETLTETFDATLSKALYKASKYLNLENYLTRIESCRATDTINCEVSIKQFGSPDEDVEQHFEKRSQSLDSLDDDSTLLSSGAGAAAARRRWRSDESLRDSLLGEGGDAKDNQEEDVQDVLEIEVNAVSGIQR